MSQPTPARRRSLFARAAGGGVLLLAALGMAGISAAERPASSREVWTFDARPWRSLDLNDPAQARRLWDSWHLLSALQGLANRDTPRLYVFYCQEFGVETDVFWFDWYRGEDGWLKDRAVRSAASLEELMAAFRDVYAGLVVYDPEVPATSNVASTAAGCEDLLPVRYDPSANSWYTRLTREFQIPVRLWLVHPDGRSKFTGPGQLPDASGTASGSAKIDVYRWAIRRYLESKRCAPGVAAYYIDAFWLRRPTRAGADLHTLSNHDYFIARRGFFFDLSAWGDERPDDDPHQPDGADRRALIEVLHALHDRADGGLVKLGGFTPWPFKYTRHAGGNGRHEGVETEWEFSRLVSQFNVYVEADAAGLSALANASFSRHYPLPPRRTQPNSRPNRAAWEDAGWIDRSGRVAPRLYVGHYVGDYDAPAWLYRAVPAFFQDPTRGQIPLAWAFNPNLADRAPQALDYAYRRATTNDFFVAGDSGAGYVNPRALSVRPDSGLGSGLRAWTEHCRRWYERWDLSITGFVLDGAAGASTDLEFRAYATFSPDGLGTHFEPEPALRAGVPTCPEKDLPESPAAAADFLARAAVKDGGRPAFVWGRSILKSPRWYAEVARELRARHPESRVDFVDPYTFFGLIRLSLLNAPAPPADAASGAKTGL